MFSVFIKLKNYFFIIFFYLFFFAIGDLIFSNYIYKKDVNIKYNCYEYKNYFFNQETYHDHYLEKNCKATEKQRTVIPYKVFTDKDGYRYSGKKRTFKKNNLLFLGDSFTYGYGVKYENSFPGIIEKKFQNFNIYNLGVPGYGIKKHYYNLSEYLKKRKVNKIYITLDMTDIHDATFRWVSIPEIMSPVIRTKHINKRIDSWKNMQNSNFKGTKLLAFYSRNFLRYIKLKLRSTNMGNKDTALKSKIANFTYTEKNKLKNLNEDNFQKTILDIDLYFEKISNLAKKNKAELYLVIFPWPETLIYGQEKFNWENFNNDLCKKNNCSKVINLFKDFEKIKINNKDWKNLIYIDDDVHLKKFGNTLIANKIIRETLN